MPLLSSFGQSPRMAVIGASGGIGAALVDHLCREDSVSAIHALSRTPRSWTDARVTTGAIDYASEESIAEAAAAAGRDGPLHLVVVATGILHDGDGMMPEKTWRTLNAEQMEKTFRINTIGPALVAKHFLPLLARDEKAVFAALSARVGSISDNQLGGWYSYRASKAALNMTIRSLSIELHRTRPQALCVGLHPGTVATGLSEPFQRNVADEKLFQPADSAARLLSVLDGLTPPDSGHQFAYDGTRLPN